jgi:hypothetical protein
MIPKTLVVGLVWLASAACQAATDSAMGTMDMPAQTNSAPEMPGTLGVPSMTQEGSGTSWQPASTPFQGVLLMDGGWMTMVQGFANAVYTHQEGPRGADALFSTNMLMVMAARHWGIGTLGLRGMFGLEPLMGPSGYPLLLQTGENADGVHTLVDRQHPHDLFMELALSYSVPLGDQAAVFAYAGLPGEPALGPPAFMERFSGVDNPVAPISHHWIDSTHETQGVVTVGALAHAFKAEASMFRGREPDYNHWDIEEPRLDSWSGRLSCNPSRDMALEVSYGHLTGHDALAPTQDENKFIASAMLNRPMENGNWQTTVGWGRNMHQGEQASNAYFIESAANFRKKHTLFMRAESAEKDDLFDAASPLSGQIYTVEEFTLGYIYDLPALRKFSSRCNICPWEFSVALV